MYTTFVILSQNSKSLTGILMHMQIWTDRISERSHVQCRCQIASHGLFSSFRRAPLACSIVNTAMHAHQSNHLPLVPRILSIILCSMAAPTSSHLVSAIIVFACRLCSYTRARAADSLSCDVACVTHMTLQHPTNSYDQGIQGSSYVLLNPVINDSTMPGQLQTMTFLFEFVFLVVTTVMNTSTNGASKEWVEAELQEL